MKKIYSNVYKPYLANLKKAKKIIENNAIIGMPTETVYGLAGNAYSNKSVTKIFNLKKRPHKNPTIIHFKNLSNLKNDVILNKNFTKLYRFFGVVDLAGYPLGPASRRISRNSANSATKCCSLPRCRGVKSPFFIRAIP